MNHNVPSREYQKSLLWEGFVTPILVNGREYQKSLAKLKTLRYT